MTANGTAGVGVINMIEMHTFADGVMRRLVHSLIHRGMCDKNALRQNVFGIFQTVPNIAVHTFGHAAAIFFRNDHFVVNHFNAGFSDEERSKFTELLGSGFIDTWRFQHPDEVKYSWWSYRGRARFRNAGWRIDYFLVSESLREHIFSTEILNDIAGSDHCPVVLCLK